VKIQTLNKSALWLLRWTGGLCVCKV